MGNKLGKTTTSLGFVICPKCGRIGQLKLRRGKYYEVHHYKGNKIQLKDTQYKRSGFKGKYLYSCYIGKYL